MKEKLASRRKARQDEQKSAQQQYEKDLKEAIQEVSTTDSGIFLLKHLHNTCGFGKPNTVANVQTGELILYSSVYNAAQENVYKTLRKFIPKKAKIQIELND